MQAIEVINALKGKAGQHVAAIWQRQVKTRKGFDGLIFKRTKAYVRAGINYSNLSDVRDAIEAGEREPVQGLPWGQWREGYANYIIDHKDKEYVRLYPAVFANLKASVEYLMDGQTVSYEQVEPFMLASEKRKPDDEKSACFNVNAADLITIADD